MTLAEKYYQIGYLQGLEKVKGLDPLHKIILQILLHFFNLGMSMKKIAGITGLPLEEVNHRLKKFKNLRKQLKS